MIFLLQLLCRPVHGATAPSSTAAHVGGLHVPRETATVDVVGQPQAAAENTPQDNDAGAAVWLRGSGSCGEVHSTPLPTAF